jgi:hypothetical protein
VLNAKDFDTEYPSMLEESIERKRDPACGASRSCDESTERSARSFLQLPDFSSMTHVRSRSLVLKHVARRECGRLLRTCEFLRHPEHQNARVIFR